MRRFLNVECINAKRLIAFISHTELHLKVDSISKLLDVSNRNVNYYISDAEKWIGAPKSNKVFFEAYNKVMEAINQNNHEYSKT
jgi:hypothetical protein